MPQARHRRDVQATRRERLSLVVAGLSLLFTVLAYLDQCAQGTDPAPTETNIYLPPSSPCQPPRINSVLDHRDSGADHAD